MYCELKSRFRHSRFAFLHELRTYLCSFGFTKSIYPRHLVLTIILRCTFFTDDEAKFNYLNNSQFSCFNTHNLFPQIINEVCYHTSENDSQD